MAGLDDFDEDAAAERLGGVGQITPELLAMADEIDALQAGVMPVPVAPVETVEAPELLPIDEAPVAAPEAVVAATPGAPAAELPAQEGNGLAPLTEDPDERLLNAPAPVAPALTGDHERDIAANMQWQRDLGAHHEARTAALLKRAAGVNQQRAANEVAVARDEEERRRKLAAQQLEERKAAQASIAEAVQARADAQKDLEGATWEDKHRGAAIVAMIAGGIQQGLMNMALIQSGHAPNAQNEGLNAINRAMAQDYERKKQKLLGASDALVQARHGYADAETNRRAALNDLDAEFAAKWKLVAREAEARARRMGVSEEDIKQLDIVANARREAAKAEGAILDREAQRQQAREHNAATEAMAAAHLGLQERQIEATAADRREAREDRRAAKDEKTADKATQRDTETALFDPATGDKLGNAPTKERAKVADEALKAINNIKGDVAALKDHVTGKETGGVVAPFGLTEASRDREALAKSLIVSMSAFKGLGAISADDRKILDGIVSGGVSSLLGANASQLDKINAAVERARASILRGEGVKEPGAAPAAAAPRPEAKPAEKKPAAQSAKLDKAIVDKLWETFDDPKETPERKRRARAALERHGLLPN